MIGRYPWYDSVWLDAYTRARETIQRVQPSQLRLFEESLEVFRTRPDFEVTEIRQPFRQDQLSEIEAVMNGLNPLELEPHEFKQFGRFVVHDNPVIDDLQRSITDLVSEAAGEPLEPSYNFISLYSKAGVCRVHMDAPNAKWTLDLCVRQSRPWPIHLSQVVPWPEQPEFLGDDWETAIKTHPDHDFTSYSLEPGDAIFFSGSSQWHYRDPQPDDGGQQFCDLVFFHFIPLGTADLVNPKKWAGLFEVPELEEAVASSVVS